MDFYQIVIVVAIAALAVILVWFAYTIRNGNKNSVYPPVSNVCPDTWVQTTDSNSNISCTATKYTSAETTNTSNTNQGVSGTGVTLPTKTGLYTYNGTPSGTVASTYTMYPNAAEWSNTGVSALCAQKRWADAYQIQWSGVSNTNTC